MASTTTDSDGGGGGLGWLDGTSSSKSLLVQGFNLERRAPAGSGDWIAEFSAWVKAVVKHVAAVRFFKQTPTGQCPSTDLNHLSAASFQGNADTSDSHHAAQITFTDAYSALRALEANGGQLVWKDNKLSLTLMPSPSPRATAAAVTTAPLSSSWPHRLVKRQSSAPGAKFRSPRAAASLASGSAVAAASSSSSSHHPPLHRIVSHRDQDVKTSHVGEKNTADHQDIFNLSRFPNVMFAIFGQLDSVSLLRCKLVSRHWNSIVQSVVQRRWRQRPVTAARWNSSNCSHRPIYPDQPSGAAAAGKEYRNVLGLKADAIDIVLAVDNGNVEVYDRFSLQLTHTIVGKATVSPVSLDMTSDVILVEYVNNAKETQSSSAAAAAASTTKSSKVVVKARRSSGSNCQRSWWKLFCRETKRLLRTLDKVKVLGFNTGFSEARLSLGPSLVLHDDQHVYSLRFQRDDTIQEYNLTAVERNPVVLSHLASVNWPRVTLSHPQRVIEGFDMDDTVITLAVNTLTEGNVSLWVFSQKEGDADESEEGIMGRMEAEVDLGWPGLSADTVQLVYPVCLVRLSNNRGSFEHVASARGRPLVRFVFVDVVSNAVLRTLTIDEPWMRKMSDVLVRYDSDTSLLSSKFNFRHLVVGFGSFSAPDDGGIAIWDVGKLLSESLSVEEEEGSAQGGDDDVETLDPPTFHWEPWENHCGGVSLLHLDSLSIVAANSCVHRVASRCVEPGDHKEKDNCIAYDFWNPAEKVDLRRPQRRQSTSAAAAPEPIFQMAQEDL